MNTKIISLALFALLCSGCLYHESKRKIGVVRELPISSAVFKVNLRGGETWHLWLAGIEQARTNAPHTQRTVYITNLGRERLSVSGFSGQFIYVKPAEKVKLLQERLGDSLRREGLGSIQTDRGSRTRCLIELQFDPPLDIPITLYAWFTISI
jgi:hypothetical protein